MLCLMASPGMKIVDHKIKAWQRHLLAKDGARHTSFQIFLLVQTMTGVVFVVLGMKQIYSTLRS